MTEPDRAGWHPDPSGAPGLERWWNGMSWGEQTRSTGWVGTGSSGPYAWPAAGPTGGPTAGSSGGSTGGPAAGQAPAGGPGTGFAPGFGSGLPPHRPGRTAKIIVLALGGIALVVVLMVVGFGYFLVKATDGPRTTANAFFLELEQGRSHAAALRLCSEYAEDGQSLLALAYSDQVQDWDATGVSISGDDATVTGQLVTGTASASTVTVTLVREDGDWKVCSLPAPG